MERLVAHPKGYQLNPGETRLYDDTLVGHSLEVAMWTAYELSRIKGITQKQIGEGYFSGLLHDLGKAHPFWQNHVPLGNYPQNGFRHEKVGAYAAMKLGVEYAAFAIGGHHHGMDAGTRSLAYSKDSKNELDECFKLLHKEKEFFGDSGRSLAFAPPPGLPEKFHHLKASPAEFFEDIQKPIAKSKYKSFTNTMSSWDRGFEQFVDLKLMFGSLVRADHICTSTYLKADREDAARHVLSMRERRTMTLDQWKRIFNDLLLTVQPRYRASIKDAINATRSKRAKTVEAARAYAQNLARRKSTRIPPGLSTLVGPTGIGKTLCAVMIAVNSIIERHEDAPSRIIIVEPYITVLNDVLKQVLSWQGVRYDAFNPRIYDPEGMDDRTMFQYTNGTSHEYVDHRVNSEMWDMPIIITSTYRFIDALFSNRPRDCKMFPSVANTVFFIDEPQVISTLHSIGSGIGVARNTPSNLLEAVLCMGTALKRYNTRFVFGTATLPQIHTTARRFNPIVGQDNDMRPRVEDVFPIIPATKVSNKRRRTGPQIQLARMFSRKVKYKYDKSVMSYAAVGRKVLDSGESCLVKLNTKAAAYRTYKELLSMVSEHDVTLKFMSGAKLSRHNEKTLEEVKVELAAKRTVILVATGIIQCGVNISFPRGFFEIGAPHDATQPAGRVNREWEIPCGHVVVFGDTTTKRGDDGFPSFYAGQRDEAEIFQKQYLSKWNEDDIAEKLSNPSIYREIMEKAYERCPKGAKNLLAMQLVKGQFEDVGRIGRQFEDNDIPVVVSCTNDCPHEVKQLIEHLDTNEKPFSSSLNRVMQENSVGIFDDYKRVNEYLSAGLIRRCKKHPKIFIATPRGYDAEVGLKIYG